MAMTTYESQLSANLTDALREGSMHFEGQSAFFLSLRKIASRLDELGIPYAIAGGMALFAHGFRRFTEGVDLLVTAEGLAHVHAALDDLGYVPPFPGSKHLRDGETKVRIEFLVAGQHPGDGRPKPVAFPDPATVSTEIEGIRYLNLPTLVDLKLASGMTAPGRLKDLADVQELIRILALPADFAERLAPYTRDKYAELWDGVQTSRRDDEP
jgi:hypothetical protein